jgi:RNA polymerase sigma factor (TIGR02999 family)
MTLEGGKDVTAVLEEARAGDPEAASRVLALIYGELRRMAGFLMRGQRPDHTLQATALVNEVIARLLRSETLHESRNGAALCAVAARAMRHILVDHNRRRGRGKRGGGWHRVGLEGVADPPEALTGLEKLALEEALQGLAEVHPQQADVVTLRFYGGLTVPEVAEVLGVSVSTVESHYRIARAWLYDRLKEEQA